MQNSEFRQFVEVIGPWFDGMAKFVGIINGRLDGIYSGEQLMLDKLKRHSHQVDKYMAELRAQFAKEDEEAISKTVSVVQHMLVYEQLVGKALHMSADQFWHQVLTETQRLELTGILNPEDCIDLCLYQPIRSLFEQPNRLTGLDDSISSLLLQEAIHDDAVTVQFNGSSTTVVWDGAAPRLEDAYSLEELLDCGRACVIDFCGFQIVIERAGCNEKAK